MLAVRDAIRAQLGYRSEQCDVQLDGRPPAFAGEIYVAVHPGNWNLDGIREALGEMYDVGVTLTMRMTRIPDDRRGRRLWAEPIIGMEDRMRAFIILVHGSYDIMLAANKIIEGNVGLVNAIIEPLHIKAPIAPPKRVGPQWFHSRIGESGDNETGLTMTAMFSEARREQQLAIGT